jgi:aerobic-type carbon monoxide dehydrogenase small subunit (CoxS/CutS family)
MTITLDLNGVARSLDVAPGETLLDALREAGCASVKRGCEAGTCGSCTVLVDGVPKLSCLLLAATADGHAVTTVEALGAPDRPHPIMTAFAAAGAVQCGYCTPGMVLSTHALLARNPHPTEADVREALDGHLCRCTGYVKQVEAVLKAADAVAER